MSKPPSALWKRTNAAAITPEAFEDLNPPITYRHLLSSALGVRDPLRVIALCDSDAFYATCEQRRLGVDPSLPLVVRQWEALIAVNYPARKYGITRMSKWKDAVKKCPELIVVHVATYKEGEKEPGYWDNVDTTTHKVSLDYYRRESSKIISIFKEGLPGGEIEKASIDEAFIDFTQPVREELLKRFPYLATVPPDAPNGLDTVLPPPPPISWEGKGIVIPINPSSTSASDQVEETAEGITDTEETQTTWHDVALSIGAEMMDKIRGAVRDQLGYTTSAGIARNKFLAKLTASYKKFDSQSILRNAAIPNYLKPMPFQKIRFLGGKLGTAIAEHYDASTVDSLLLISLDEMQGKFGEESIWVYEVLRGIDRTEVKEKPPMAKSMMASKNLPQPITKVSEGPHWLRVLAAELALRLNEARSSSSSIWPKSIVLHVRRGYETSRSRQAGFPFVRDLTVDVVAAAGDKLWKELMGDSKDTAINVTNVALGFSGLEAGENGQQNIEGFFQAGPSKPVSRSDTGSAAGIKRKRRASTDPQQHSPLDVGRELDEQHSTSSPYVCPRCHKRIRLEEDVPDGREAALTRLRMEHDDFHLAQDLSRAVEPGNSSHTGSEGLRIQDQPPGKQRKKKKEGKTKGKGGQGIAEFFLKRS